MAELHNFFTHILMSLYNNLRIRALNFMQLPKDQRLVIVHVDVPSV